MAGSWSFSVSMFWEDKCRCMGRAAMALLNWATAEIRRVRSSEISFLRDSISAAWSVEEAVVAVLVMRHKEVVDVGATAAAGKSMEQLESYSKIATCCLRGGRLVAVSSGVFGVEAIENCCFKISTYVLLVSEYVGLSR